MKLNVKRTLLVTVALSTFFGTALSLGAKNNWNQRMVKEAPGKVASETEVKAATPSQSDKELSCRTAVLTVNTFFSVESRWGEGKSDIKVPYLKSGSPTIKVDCTSALPPLKSDASVDVTSGKIDVKCVDGALIVTGNDCYGKTIADFAREAEVARLAAVEAAKAEEARAVAAEAARVEAARVAAEQAAAQAAADQAAAAAAAAACPVNACGGCCNAGTATYKYNKCSGKNTAGSYQIIYRDCNNGQRQVTGSTNGAYSSGQCITALPASC